MKFIARLMPQEGRFFEYFRQHATLIGQGGQALVDLLAAYDRPLERSKFIDRVESLEHQADRVTRDLVSLLHSTFITPFDRDDIHRLISRMDDILDLIQDTAESTVLYDIQAMTAEARQLADCVKRCCDLIQRAVELLTTMENSPEILRICQDVDVLESDADRIMRAAISSLFRNEQDTRQLIKLKAVYELLEAATDKCQDVANVIESVVLENA